MAAASVSVRDDLGRTVTFAAPAPGRALRIVSLTPAGTENLFAVGAGALVVGVSTADDYPPQVKRLPRVGNFYQPSVERVRALAPDLVLVDSATITPAAAEAFAARLRAPLFVQLSNSYDDVERHLLQLGQITGRPPAARAVIAQMRRKTAQAEKSVRGKRPVRVFVEVGQSPLFAAGPGTFVDDLLRRARGVNVVKGTTGYLQYSREALLAADPDHYIVASGGDMGRAPGKPTLPPPLDRLRAAREGNVHRIPSDLLFRPTPRIADGLILLARALHG